MVETADAVGAELGSELVGFGRIWRGACGCDMDRRNGTRNGLGGETYDLRDAVDWAAVETLALVGGVLDL